MESKARVRLMEVLALKRERDGERGIEEMMRDVEAVLGRDGRGEKGWTREEMRAASGMKGEDFDRVYFGTFLRGTSYSLAAQQPLILRSICTLWLPSRDCQAVFGPGLRLVLDTY